MSSNMIDASGNRIRTNPHNSDSEEEKDMGWTDPAHCNGHRTLTCQCRGPPAAITDPVIQERDLDEVLEADEDDLILKAARTYRGRVWCDNIKNEAGYEMQSQYADYELSTEITPYTNPTTGEQYAMYQMSIWGMNHVYGGGEVREQLLIGEQSSTPSGAITSLFSVLTWFGNYGHEDVELDDDWDGCRIVVGEKPVRAEVYSWNKCSICYNHRVPDPNYFCDCNMCEDSRKETQQAIDQAFEF